MKSKRLGWILGVGAGLLLQGGGCGKGGPDHHEWLSAELARRVDRQFGEVITHDPSSPQDGDGSHEGDKLLGQVTLGTVTQVVQYLTEQLLIPADPSGNLGKLMTPTPLLSKLVTIASAAVDQNPCRRDTDNDGIPDIKEDLNDDPVGLCTIPAAVDCVVHGDHSFTVKFSHCIPVTTASPATWSPQVVTTFFTPLTVRHTASTSTVSFGRLFFCRLTNTTTNSTITNSTLATWQTWRIGNVGCQGGTLLNFQIVYTPQLYRITATTDDYNTVDLIYDGAITLHFGAAGVDEQLFHLTYNRFTRVWGDAHSGTTQNSRYLTLDGPSMNYRVITPTGAPARGSTPFPVAHDVYINPDDGMIIEKYHVTFDPDGEAGPQPAGSYRVNRGVDNEDGRFFLDGANQVVSLKDKNGPDPADLLSSPKLGIEVDGVRVLGATTTTITFALNLYDLNALLGNGLPGDNLGAKCGKPFSNTRCRLVVEIHFWQRTFDVLEVDPSTCLQLWDWTPTNPKYLDVSF
ncbi:MAG: hypothetical protein A2V67_05155 [Deltaproteobacteria bacterium RBG_13_61_14]|nr:MAG: hypothetical protein A2V67_05155 [Deltaproteobacteria bacterium RBG_13_61_14]